MPFRLVGSSSIDSRVNCVVAVVDVVSTIGDAPETVTVSSSAPTFSFASTLADNQPNNRQEDAETSPKVSSGTAEAVPYVRGSGTAEAAPYVRSSGTTEAAPYVRGSGTTEAAPYVRYEPADSRSHDRLPLYA